MQMQTEILRTRISDRVSQSRQAVVAHFRLWRSTFLQTIYPVLGNVASGFQAVLPDTSRPVRPCRELAGRVPAGAILLGNSIVSYQWLNSNNQQIATVTVRLPDGRHTLTLVVTDATGAT
jgi:hypothetical protein